MKTLSALKQDLEFNSGLSGLVGVLKNIAVSQYRALETRAKTNDKLKEAIYSFLEVINPSQVAHPFLNPSQQSQIVVAVTSDSGLIGGLNKDVVDTALKELSQTPGQLVVVGERGRIWARESNVPFTSFSGIKEEDMQGQALQLRNYLLSKFLEQSCGYLKIVYPRAASFSVQKIETLAFLPFRLEAMEMKEPSPLMAEVILESMPADVVEYCVYLWMGQKLMEIFMLSKLAEYGARFAHMERSSQKLKELDASLRLQYFRVRHELIDRNMRELFAARQLYAG
ncbi:MAG: F0F1 ATP synthase subunit gamma [Candidatus Omnitrophica bacterium]|nr:F0F1 ATP synthase subunit gamma [Candidatus Omnitrophota bacterium]